MVTEVRIKSIILVFAFLLLFTSIASTKAGITDCASGYTWVRMSGVGCQQTDCRSVSHAFYDYTGHCVCYACGEVGCSGDKEFSKGCYRPGNYAACPNCLYKCVNPKDHCPDTCPNGVCDKVELEDCGTCPQDCACKSTKNQILSCDKENPKADDIGCYPLVTCPKNAHVEHEKCQCDTGYEGTSDNTACLKKGATTTTIRATSTTTTSVPNLNETLWEEVKKKCNNATNINPTFTSDEFMEYVKRLEVDEDNRGQDWRHVITRLHADAYPHDINRVEFGFRLFQDGPQSDGSQSIDLICRRRPKFVTHNNQRIDIHHSYAGLRSDLNRQPRNLLLGLSNPFDGFGRWFMRNVNTNWGDYYQVLVSGGNRNFAPPDQLLGNDVGIWLSSYYKTPQNREKPLSEAYREYFNTH